jgi:uncharacterized membrane protein YfcA
MPADLLRYFLIGLVVFSASAAQSAVGFGYGLFATPLLLWLGLPLQGVVTMIATCSMLQASISAFKLRDATPWRSVWGMTSIRVIFMVLGLILLKLLANLHIAQVRLVIGVILCLLVALQLLCRPRPALHLAWYWGILASVSSGLLTGTCGMGGPPMVLWAMAHDWPSKKMRGFLFGSFAAANPPQLLFLSIAFGPAILWYSLLGGALLPLVYLGALVGMPIGNRMNRQRLRWIAYALLAIIGISAIVPALFGIGR